MNIVIIGASGKAGSFLTKEAASRGHTVMAIMRDKRKGFWPGVKELEKDLFALTYDDLEEYEVIINAFGTHTAGTEEEHQTSLRHLADLLSGKSNRLLVVGGAGSLYVDPGHTTRLVETPDFPEIYKPVSASMMKAFIELQKRNDVKWTYLSPSANFDPQGTRTGKYAVGKDELLFNSQGESSISYADYAIAMIDEAEAGKYVNARFTVCSL